MKKFLFVLISIIMAIGLVSARPLVINADTITNINLKGYSSHIDLINSGTPYNISLNGSSMQVINDQYTLHVIGMLDDEYVGYANILVTYYIAYSCSYNTSTSSYVYTSDYPSLYRTVSHYVYIDGNSFDWFDTYNAIVRNDVSLPLSANIQSVSISTSNVVQTSVIDDLDDMISILQDQYNELISIGDSLDITNQYLDILSKLRQYNIFFESYPVLSYSLRNYTPLDYYQNDYWNYPIFEYSANQVIAVSHFNTTRKNILILLVNKNIYNVTTFNNFLTLTPRQSGTNLTIESVTQLNVFEDPTSFVLIKVIVKSDTNTYVTLTPNSTVRGVPIYWSKDNIPVSTDFALMFGLSNQLLDDLHIVAQGTQQSNSSSSDLEESAQEYGELADDVLGLEDDLSSGFSSSLNNVPTSFNFSTQFGNKFLHSATWVRTQFETLTTNTPFGALITFSLVLGLALLLVGRRLL